MHAKTLKLDNLTEVTKHSKRITKLSIACGFNGNKSEQAARKINFREKQNLSLSLIFYLNLHPYIFNENENILM